MPTDPNLPQVVNQTTDILIPALAGGAGAMVGAALGPPRTYRQHVSEVGAMVVSTVLFGPWLCENLGVESAASRAAGAVYGILGLFGPLVLRGVISIAEEIRIQSENNKSQTAKVILGIANKLLLNRIAGWILQPEQIIPTPAALPESQPTTTSTTVTTTTTTIGTT